MGSEVGNILSRQGSLHSLTLDEVQNQLGKPLNSMNLDELLSTLSASEPKPGSIEPVNDVGSQAGQPGTLLQWGRSGSHMISFSKHLGNKTVEEVWKEMQQGNENKRESGNDGHVSFQESTNGSAQLCLGEMTLEDFLMSAGATAVSSSSHENANSSRGIDPVPAPVHAQWMQCQQHFSVPQHQPPPQDTMTVFMPVLDVNQPLIPAGSCPILDAIYPNESRIPIPQENGGKGIASEDVAVKIVERKHKRMLKNRESAARSRARRQAYTQELENKIKELEEENAMLRRTQKEDANMLPSTPPSKSKSRLRRTSSASF